MIRTFRRQTLNGSAQPWFGDVLTAAFVPPSNQTQALGMVTVADTTIYQVGDRIILGVGQAGQNIVIVDRIFSSTVLYVRSEGDAKLSPWASSTVIALSIACAVMNLQAAGTNAADVFVGSDNTVTNSGGGNAIGDISVFGTFTYPPSGHWNIVRTSDLWMAGANLDKVFVYAIVI